jgi:hypothetical protein
MRHGVLTMRDDRRMRRLTTISAGWVWLTVAYGLSTAISIGLGALFFAAGCNDAAHARAPSIHGLCYASGPGPAVKNVAHTAMLLVIAVGTMMAIIAVSGRLARQSGSAARAWPLLITTITAASVVILMEIVLRRADLAILLAPLTGLICVAAVGSISLGLAVLIASTGRRSRRRRDLNPRSP